MQLWLGVTNLLKEISFANNNPIQQWLDFPNLNFFVFCHLKEFGNMQKRAQVIKGMGVSLNVDYTKFAWPVFNLQAYFHLNLHLHICHCKAS